MKSFWILLLTITTVLLLNTQGTAQCVSITAIGTAVTQDFNTLALTGTSSTLPTGWALLETGTGANSTYSAGTGSANSGDTFSFGLASDSDRAFGGLLSNSVTPTVGACFTNVTGNTLTALNINYTGEQWRLGASGRNDRLDFQYSTNASSLGTGAWTDVDALDFVAPIATGTPGALNGNLAANRANVTGTVNGVSIANGQTFWIRWNDFNATGSDDGLAVDDFSLTAQGSAPPPTISINDVMLAEGNSGTTNAVFTVSLTSPATTTVVFDFGTADNTATAGSDYVAAAGQGLITAGNSTTTISVSVLGDTVVEPNETFFVNLLNITGATVGDAQGQGTINNDDVALPTITLESSTFTEDEGQTLIVVVERTGDLSGTSTVEYSNIPPAQLGALPANPGASCGAGVDYVINSGVLTFPPNEVAAEIQIEMCPDTIIENPEQLPLTLSNFTNASPGANVNAFVVINDAASQYTNFDTLNLPSSGESFFTDINVVSSATTISGLRLTLFDTSILGANNLDVLLVAPNGRTMILMADAGGSANLAPTTLTFSDDAGQVLPQNSTILPGVYEPTSWVPGQSNFNAPAPTGPYNEPGSAVGGPVTLSSVFNGTNPNGTWRVFVRDDRGAFQSLGINGQAAGWGIQFFVPTSAGVSVEGSVRTGKSAVRDAIVTISGGSLETPLTTRVNTFGRFKFEGLAAGQTYVVTVVSSRHTIPNSSRVISTEDSVTELEFVADEQ